MATHQQQNTKEAIYFITFTCYRWLPLWELGKAYDLVYRWFDYLSSQQVNLLGYVIMPNHVHVLLHLTAQTPRSLNQLVASGKRFMAYGLVKALQAHDRQAILQMLQQGVSPGESAKGKQHQVFRLSFDARQCMNREMVEQKLRYIHHNPVQGKWSLVADYVDYSHSSAAFYELGVCTGYAVTDYRLVVG